MEGTVDRTRFAVFAFVFVAVVFAGWWATVDLWYPATDTLALIESSRVESWADLLDRFASPILSGTAFGGSYYRPVSELSYALDYAIWGLYSPGYQLTNIALHAAVAVATCYLVALSIDAGADGGEAAWTTWAALAGTGLVFAFHPLAAEIVPAPARRQDVLAALFLLLSTIAAFAYISPRRGGGLGTLVVAWGAAALAFLSKEIAPALAVPVLGYLLFAGYRRERKEREVRRKYLTAAVGFGALVVAYAGVRTAALGGLGEPPVDPAGWFTSFVKLPVHYAARLLHPVPDLFLQFSNSAALLVGAGLVAGGLLVRWRFRDLDGAFDAKFFWFVPLLFGAGLVLLPLERWVVTAAYRGEALTFVRPVLGMRDKLPLGRYLEIGDLCIAVPVTAVLAVASIATVFRYAADRIGAVWRGLAVILLAAPGLVYVVTGSAKHLSRKLYLPLVALALLAGWAVERLCAERGANGKGRRGAVAYVALSGMLVALCPAFYGLPGWSTTTSITREILERTRDASGRHAPARIEVHNLPRVLHGGFRRTPTATNVVTNGTHYTLRSFLRLDSPGGIPEVVICSKEVLHARDVRVDDIEVLPGDETLRVEISYLDNTYGHNRSTGDCPSESAPEQE